MFKKKECAGELNSIKRPRRPQKATREVDHRILYLVKKNTFPTSRQVKNTLEMVG